MMMMGRRERRVNEDGLWNDIWLMWRYPGVWRASRSRLGTEHSVPIKIVLKQQTLTER